MTEKIDNVVSAWNVFDTEAEALAFRKKLEHADLYGVYGMWQSKEKQLWVAMPLVALEVIANFREPRENP